LDGLTQERVYKKTARRKLLSARELVARMFCVRTSANPRLGGMNEARVVAARNTHDKTIKGILRGVAQIRFGAISSG
jgi:hypothetical protein